MTSPEHRRHMLVAVALSLVVAALVSRDTPLSPQPLAPKVDVDSVRAMWETPGAHDAFRDLYSFREVCVQYRRWERAVQDRVESMHRQCEEQGN